MLFLLPQQVKAKVVTPTLRVLSVNGTRESDGSDVYIQSSMLFEDWLRMYYTCGLELEDSNYHPMTCPTRNHLLTAIDTHFSSAAEYDVSLFYFSGHGTKFHDFVCSYSQFDDGGTIGYKELFEAIDKIKGKKIIFIDCCYSGSFITSNEIENTDDYYIVTSTEDTLSFNEVDYPTIIDKFLDKNAVRYSYFVFNILKGIGYNQKMRADDHPKDDMVDSRELFGYLVNKYQKKYVMKGTSVYVKPTQYGNYVPFFSKKKQMRVSFDENTSFTVREGETLDLLISATGSGKVKCTSSDSSIATVTNKGKEIGRAHV